jgi:GTP cyclohydrolase I
MKANRVSKPCGSVAVRSTEVEARNAVRALLTYVGEDPDREGLRGTPDRVVRAWDELTLGYYADPARILAADFHGNGYDQMVHCKRIRVVSVCEHHLLPFTGYAWVAYVPRHRVVGLSKMARLVHCFARRLQIQEKLTGEVAAAMWEHLRPKGVGVRVEAVHSCMSCRGVMEPESSMVTTALLGCFKQHKVKEEFLLECLEGSGG